MKQSDLLFQKLWGAVNIVRGEVNSSEYLDLILHVLTIKVLNDNSDHPYAIPETAKWNNILIGQSIDNNLNRAVFSLQEENEDLSGVMAYDFKNVTRDESLHSLLRHMDRLNLTRSKLENPDPLRGTLAQAIDQFIERIADHEGKKGAEYHSPKEIGMLLAEILRPQQGTVYDGATGMGRFLIETAKQAPNYLQLYGQEINQRTWRLNQLNFILHSLYDTHIAMADTIREPQWVQDHHLKTFDYVLMNPPFGLKNWGQEVAETDPFGRFKYGVPSAVSGDIAFVLHALASLNTEGKAALVVPHGILFRSGSDQQIRKAMLEDGLVEAIISLPSNLFSSTGIPVAILVLNRNSRHPGQVQFINAKEGYQRERGRNRLREQDIKKIVEAYHEKKEVERYSQLIPLKEIQENDWILSVERYVEALSIETKIGEVFVNTKRYEASGLNLKELNQLCEPKPFRGMNPPKKGEEDEPNYHLINLVDVQDGNILFDQLKSVTVNSRRALRFEVRPGDVIIASRGTVLKVAVVPVTEMNLLATNNFIVARPKEELDPFYLKAFLESPLGIHYFTTRQHGTIAPVINSKDVGAIPIPLFELEEQQKIAQQIMKAEQDRKQTIEEANRRHQQQLQSLYRDMRIMEFVQQEETDV
ncbi:N-6 DNA methylase [Paludifilum halophilum]|uniref:site-specific DNA-methyltransferase (adenine-specific) n=1 Tax=Paludifilum halophilum TaxID=1642702 RepID=A0A235B538_9BACL|nr:N-6 DNA methylase [Paludifilum halophilum]OYD06725.1 hypothetical protein CHM34_14195 [Paludifilum halophilum]